jgi:hypothetical protein
VSEGWRSKAARDLAAAVRRAGGTVERTGKGRLRITGPAGTAVVAEPGASSGNDKRAGNTVATIHQRTGLDVEL